MRGGFLRAPQQGGNTMLKLSEIFAKLTRSVKNHTLAVAGTAILAGAALTAAAPAAEAQHVGFGISVGVPAPAYYPPAPIYGGYYGYYGHPWGYPAPYYHGYYGHPWGGYYGHPAYGRGWRR
jgi:hypothetical protein